MDRSIEQQEKNSHNNNNELIIENKLLKAAPVRVLSTIKSDLGEESIDFYAHAKFGKRGDAHYVMYEETEIVSSQPDTRLLKYDGKTVEVSQMHQVNSKIILELNKEHHSLYSIEYGGFPISTTAKHIEWKDDPIIDIFLRYDLDIGGQYTQQITIEIQQFN